MKVCQRDDKWFDDYSATLSRYEELLFLLAKFSTFVEDEYQDAAQRPNFDFATYGLILVKIEECATLLGSQSAKWRDASLRLSAGPSDFGMYELSRAIATIRIPREFENLRSMTLSTFGHCPVHQFRDSDAF